jgi:hypothetical protein
MRAFVMILVPWLLLPVLLALPGLRRRIGVSAGCDHRCARRPPLPRGGVPPVMRAPRLSGID